MTIKKGPPSGNAGGGPPSGPRVGLSPAPAKPAPADGARGPSTQRSTSTSKPPARGAQGSSRRAALPPRAQPAPIKVKKPKRLEEITEAPPVDPEIAARAKARGAVITPFNPNDVEAFLRGYVTLGELQGISKPEQYQMAEVGYRLLSEGKLDKGIQVFLGLAALDPYDAYFLTALGSAHQQKDQLAEAERYYSRALEINPFSTTARAHRGEVRALLGRPLEAVEDLKRAVKEDPAGKDPAVHRARVMLASMLSQLEAAESQRGAPSKR